MFTSLLARTRGRHAVLSSNDRFGPPCSGASSARLSSRVPGGRNKPEVAFGRRSARDSQRTPLGLRRDRKSTRLNSSHVRISYAVFCLKKKTGQSNALDRQPVGGR